MGEKGKDKRRGLDERGKVRKGGVLVFFLSLILRERYLLAKG